MLYDYELNAMNEDELRNYAHHQNEMIELYGEVMCAKYNMIEALQKAYNEQSYMYDRLLRLNRLRGEFRPIEIEIEEKYIGHRPHPVCNCECDQEGDQDQ